MDSQKLEKKNNKRFITTTIIIMVLVSLLIFVLMFWHPGIGLITYEKANWWTDALCENGEIVEGPLLNKCVNSSGEYRADFGGEYCLTNRTKSCGPYWHLIKTL